MPVSRTEKATTCRARFSASFSSLQPRETGRMPSSTEPESVNLKALESRFLRICISRVGSVVIARGSPCASSTLSARCF